MTHTASPTGSLLKVLGVAFGLAVLVGNTIGMGILRTPGEVAAQVPSVPLYMGVWVLGALYALLGAMTMSELGAMFPRSGGQYSIVRETLGAYPAFVVGWGDWISTCGSMAAVTMVLVEYAGPLFPQLAGRETLTASVIMLLFGVMQYRGIRIGDVAQQTTSLLKAIALLALAGVALVVTVEPTSAATVAAPVSPVGVALFTAVIIAMQSAIFTYDGWAAPIYFGDELVNPTRAIPRTMIGGVLLVLFIYLALNAAFLRVIPIEQMAGDPFVAASAANKLFGVGGDQVLRIVMAISLLAAINAQMLMASRVPHAMAQDDLAPAIMRRVNPGGTPVTSLAVSVVVALLFIVSNTFDTVLALLAFLFVMSYALSFTGFFVARWKQPDRVRPFRVPLYPVVPGLALAGSVAFMVSALLTDSRNSGIAVAMIVASWPVYAFVRRKQR